jgi:hypothetical protein
MVNNVIEVQLFDNYPSSISVSVNSCAFKIFYLFYQGYTCIREILWNMVERISNKSHSNQLEYITESILPFDM